MTAMPGLRCFVKTPGIRAAVLLLVCSLCTAEAVTLQSPNGKLSADIRLDTAGALTFSLKKDALVLIEPSRIGVTVDGEDLGTQVELGAAETGEIDENFPLLGGKSAGRNQARALKLALQSKKNGLAYFLEARASDKGFAWRLSIPGKAVRKVNGENSIWTLPAGCRVWFYERNNEWKLKSYAGECTAADVDQLPTVSSQGPVQCSPLVAELPQGEGYLAIAEAALSNYSGLRLKAIGQRRVQANFTEGEKGFEIRGDIVTPWRVTLFAETLDQLANNDLIPGLNPPPDPVLFARRDYIKPGRCVWRWWSSGTGSPEQERGMIDDAALLGFEYSMIDDGWEKWPESWKKISELAGYGRDHQVGIFLWKDSKDVRSPENDYLQLRTFLDACKAAGAAGVKVDFFNSEAKSSIDLQQALLRCAAERQLMVVMHGVQKPTGESRTFPNEITREGIRGLELNKMPEGPIRPTHNAALPYTRFFAGAGDYTPLGYSNPGPTTWTHQLATVAQFSSPLMVIAENPDKLLRDPNTQPGLEVLKAMPATWDETRILAPSRIGELSLMARRKGNDWFLSALTGAAPVELPTIDLSFLGTGHYQAEIITSPTPRSLKRERVDDFTSQKKLPLKLLSGDGIVVWFRHP